MLSRFLFALGALLLVPACASSSAPADAAPPATPATTSTPGAPAPVQTAAPAAAVDPNACPLGKPDSWKACEGKLVEVRGREPQMIMQHPVMAPMAPPGSDQPAMQQMYLETAEGNQIIVLTRKPQNCPGGMRVKGNLRGIDMGGPAGTKQSYKGWSIDDAVIVCE